MIWLNATYSSFYNSFVIFESAVKKLLFMMKSATMKYRSVYKRI